MSADKPASSPSLRLRRPEELRRFTALILLALLIPLLHSCAESQPYPDQVEHKLERSMDQVAGEEDPADDDPEHAHPAENRRRRREQQEQQRWADDFEHVR